MRAHRVRALLMGGQACVFYGAAEFSRDTDFAILADAAKPQPACAKRLECVELAPAFEPPPPYDSAIKLDALQTVRVAVHPQQFS